MNSATNPGRSLLLSLLVAMFCVLPAVSIAAEASRYVTTTIRGVLTDPKGTKPMPHALIRFTSVDDPAAIMEVVADEKGEFALSGLSFGRYSVEIETADGVKIRGINSVNISDKKSVINFKFSDRLRSDTLVENEGDRIMTVVKTKRGKWKRFWAQFAIFMGIAGAGSTL